MSEKPGQQHVTYITDNCYECSFKEVMVVDEIEEKIIYNAAIIFGAERIASDSNSTFHCLAENTYQTYLIEETPASASSPSTETKVRPDKPESTEQPLELATKNTLVGDWIRLGKQIGVENSDFKAVLTQNSDGTLSLAGFKLKEQMLAQRDLEQGSSMAILPP